VKDESFGNIISFDHKEKLIKIMQNYASMKRDKKIRNKAINEQKLGIRKIKNGIKEI
jgi:hypothetical protein